MLPDVDGLAVLSTVGAVVTAINQTLIRKKLWIGWALALPNICLFMFLQWHAGAYGYAFILGPFWLFNAVLAIRDWRASPEPRPAAEGARVQ